MEYLSGGDLHEYIEKCGPLPLEKIRSISAEILCGLQYLHTMGIVHRDIKAKNILLDKDGHIKITDFGTAVTDAYGKMIKGLVGTPCYMAPEMWSEKPYNWAVDYFAFGLTVYEMATGRSVMKAIFTCQPSYSSKMNPDLKDLFERLVCKDQENRRRLVRNLRSHPFFQSINWLELEEGKARSPCVMTRMSRFHNNWPVMGTRCDRCAWAHPNHLVWNRFHMFRPLRFSQSPLIGLLKQL
ncbi:protein kinase C delta type-like [Rana temporaria]|uniref:protein kinase C delta type-like n=1 Tax=Rana temporaria TaxID=8407 RepID=UPI001AAD2BF5|nr:protein kinase C delta type-like [Rana temporaria]